MQHKGLSHTESNLSIKCISFSQPKVHVQSTSFIADTLGTPGLHFIQKLFLADREEKHEIYAC